MYLSKAKRDTIADMVLAARVNTRLSAVAQRTKSDDRFEHYDNEAATTYALDLALGLYNDDNSHKLEHLHTLKDSGNQDALVALIRLEKLGVIEA